jgi:hypothetical protein
MLYATQCHLVCQSFAEEWYDLCHASVFSIEWYWIGGSQRMLNTLHNRLCDPCDILHPCVRVDTSKHMSYKTFARSHLGGHRLRSVHAFLFCAENHLMRPLDLVLDTIVESWTTSVALTYLKYVISHYTLSKHDLQFIYMNAKRRWATSEVLQFLKTLL